MPIKPTKVDAGRRPAGRPAHPQKPVLSEKGRFDRRGEQHRHAALLPHIPGLDQFPGIGEHLRRQSPARLGLLGRRGGSLAFHAALVETHTGDSTAARHPESSRFLLRAILGSPTLRSSLGSKPKALRLSEDSFEQSDAEILEIKSIFLGERARVSSVIAVFSDAMG